MNFIKYLIYRISAREAESIIYKSVERAKESGVNSQFPSIGKSIVSGLFVSLGLIAIYLILSLFDINSFNWLIPVVIGLILVVELFLKKFTFGLKEVPVKKRDKRYKSGYRTEYVPKEDYSVKVLLDKKHRIACYFEAIIILLGTSSIIVLQFIIYPTIK